MEQLVIGVDISKGNFTSAEWVNQQARELPEQSNDRVGFTSFGAIVNERQSVNTAKSVLLVLEPTGGYEEALVAFAYEQGWQVALPNPKLVRDWGKGIGKRAKTDRMDAKLLAQFGVEQRPKPQPALAVEVSELDHLLARQHDLEGLLQQERNRLSEIGCRPHVPKGVIASLESRVQTLADALAQIEQLIQEQLNAPVALKQERQRLQTAPGIGPKNSLPVLVLLHRWQTLTHGQGSDKGLTAYVGLDPQPYESGASVYRRASISKMANSEIRRLLYMGALGAMRGKNPLRTFYDRLLARGKAKKLALVAASRKLLIYAWKLFSSKTSWNPDFHPLPS